MLPVIFESGFISIKTYWVFTVAALLISAYLAVNRLKRQRVDFLLLIKSSSSYVLIPIIVSRLTFFILNTDTYSPALDLRTLFNLFSIWDQGLSIWGGIIGFFIILTFRLIKAKEEIWKWYDALVVPLLIGLAIINIGQFMGGFAYGSPTELPWGISYELDNVKYTVPIHPTQIYSLIAIILILWSKKKFNPNQNFSKKKEILVFTLGATGSFTFFLLEFLRGDDTITILNIRLDAYLFFLLSALCTYVLFHRYKEFKHHKHESTETTGSELPV